MKRILMSVLVIAVVAAVASVGLSGAIFSNSETSTGNTFSAGTLDLQLGETEELPLTVSDLAPCVDSDQQVITFKNVGTIDGKLSFTMTIAGEADVTDAPDPDMSADDFAKLVYVSEALYTPDGGSETDVLADWKSYADTNSDGFMSIYEMAQKTWSMTETLTASGSAVIKVKVHLGDQLNGNGTITSDGTTVNNDAQGDGVNVTINATLTQA